MKEEEVREVLHLLDETYPEAGPELHFSNPYETLVATILSAQCTDKQVNKVTPAVFARWPDPAAMAKAQIDELYPMVKSCGFRTKSDHIIESCRIICEKYGGEVPNTMEALTSLPGVGRKTANVVLSNAFGIPAIAVDTHVFRVSNRIGLADADTVERTEEQLRAAIPMGKWSIAHHWLIWHGRRCCKAQRPMCETCPLASLCKFRQSQLNGEQ